MHSLQIASSRDILEQKILDRTARVGIVGLGYVGLPLAVEFARAGFHVTGIDVQEQKVASLNRGKSYIQDIPDEILAPLVESGHFEAVTDFSVVSELDTINVCVPTPLRKTKDPDMSYIVEAGQQIAKYFHPGMLVISGIHYVSGDHRGSCCCRCSKRPGSKPAKTFFCASLRSASTRAIPNSRP